jgi:Transcription factor WhiB
MIPAQGPRHAADHRSRQRSQARTGGQAPALPARPSLPVRLQFSRSPIPHTRRGACASHDPDLWFSDAPQDIAQAKAICHRCADQAPCLAGAMQRREIHGIWGGVNLGSAPRRAAVTGECQPERRPSQP